MRLTYAFVSYSPDEAPQIGAVLVELASLWQIEWLTFVWEDPDHPLYQQGIDAAPGALNRLREKTIADVDPRLPGVWDWVRRFGPYSNDLGMMSRTAELDISDGDTLSIGASREELRAALRRPSLRELAARHRIEIKTDWRSAVPFWRRFAPSPEVPVGDCLICGHNWREHDRSEEVCSECAYEMEHDEAPLEFVPCKLVPYERRLDE
jgi:hypothetical protein